MAARVRLQIDVGFGDAVTPPPVRMDLPVLLDFPMPRLLVYPRETVVAEKLDAIVQLGTANSRMKDFYDLFVLARGSTAVRRPLATRRAVGLNAGRSLALAEGELVAGGNCSELPNSSNRR